jgi:hypothetical protein
MLIISFLLVSHSPIFSNLEVINHSFFLTSLQYSHRNFISQKNTFMLAHKKQFLNFTNLLHKTRCYSSIAKWPTVITVDVTVV